MRAYLRLVRLPNLFTAAADSAAGFALMAATDDTPVLPKIGKLAAVMFVSAALYASGVVFNDCLDADKDRRHRPEGPIASGAVPLLRAYALGLGLTFAALLAAMLQGLGTTLYAGGVITAIWLYNGVLRRFVVLGAVAMGLCRFLNMQMGMTTSLNFSYPSIHENMVLLWAPALLGAYSGVITVVANYEDHPAGRFGRWVLFGSAAAMMGVLAGMALLVVETIAGWLVLMALIPALALTFVALLVRLTFVSVRRAVGISVILIIAFDAAVALGRRDAPLWLGLAILASLVPAGLLARKLSPS